MPTPEGSNGDPSQTNERVSRALLLEAIMEECIVLDDAIPAAEIERQLVDRMFGGDRRIGELVGSPLRRRVLYTLLGELVSLGHAEDSSEGMVFNRQAIGGETSNE